MGGSTTGLFKSLVRYPVIAMKKLITDSERTENFLSSGIQHLYWFRSGCAILSLQNYAKCKGKNSPCGLFSEKTLTKIALKLQKVLRLG